MEVSECVCMSAVNQMFSAGVILVQSCHVIVRCAECLPCNERVLFFHTFSFVAFLASTNKYKNRFFSLASINTWKKIWFLSIESYKHNNIGKLVYSFYLYIQLTLTVKNTLALNYMYTQEILVCPERYANFVIQGFRPKFIWLVVTSNCEANNLFRRLEVRHKYIFQEKS